MNRRIIVAKSSGTKQLDRGYLKLTVYNLHMETSMSK